MGVEVTNKTPLYIVGVFAVIFTVIMFIRYMSRRQNTNHDEYDQYAKCNDGTFVQCVPVSMMGFKLSVIVVMLGLIIFMMMWLILQEQKCV